MFVMRTQPRPRILTAAGAAVLSLALLTGCAAMSSGGGSYEESAPNGVGDPEMAQDSSSEQGGAPADGTLVTDRAVITTGEMGITTSDVAGATDAVETLVTEFEGRIDARSERTGERTTTTLTVRVPADDYEALIEQLRDVGTVEYVTTSAEDVTMMTVDLDARIASLEASVESLRGMLEQATSVEDMLQVETTLSEREAELQSLRAQQQALADQVSMSTLTVTISNDELANPTSNNDGFFGGLQAGWNAMLAFFGGLLTALGFMLPGLILLAIIAAIVIVIIRLSLRGRRARRAAAGAQPTMAMAGADAPGQPGAHAGSLAPQVDAQTSAAAPHQAPPHQAPNAATQTSAAAPHTGTNASTQETRTDAGAQAAHPQHPDAPDGQPRTETPNEDPGHA